MPNTKVRVVGSGFTTFNYRGQPIAFLESFTDSGQEPFAIGGPGYEAITPLGDKHPREIVTTRVLMAGTLRLTIRELWNAPVWQQLVGLAGTNDIVEVYQRLADDPSEVTCQMIIKPPGAQSWRGKVYHGCVVVMIEDGENVTTGALSVPRNLTIAYTHHTPFSANAA